MGKSIKVILLGQPLKLVMVILLCQPLKLVIVIFLGQPLKLVMVILPGQPLKLVIEIFLGQPLKLVFVILLGQPLKDLLIVISVASFCQPFKDLIIRVAPFHQPLKKNAILILGQALGHSFKRSLLRVFSCLLQISTVEKISGKILELSPSSKGLPWVGKQVSLS